MRIAFLHPDLGIGGAERLVVDAALGLQDLGHHVDIYTSHHDPGHSFEETNDGTLKVKHIASPFPRSIVGKFHIAMAHARQLHLTAYLLSPWAQEYDVYFVDQLSTCIPFLRTWSGRRVVFYCHFPDKLLANGEFAWNSKKRMSLLKSLYRLPMDWLEETTTRQADIILANSRFTARVFKAHFPSIPQVPKIVYPGINTAAYEANVNDADPDIMALSSSRPTFISLNRFERKKNAALALKAFVEFRNRSQSREDLLSYRLVLAGGYDPRLEDNIETLDSLLSFVKSEDITYNIITPSTAKPIINTTPTSPTYSSPDVLFLLNFTTAQRTALLTSRNTKLMMYTPANEHFGIGPVEGMVCGLPVLACDSGGPTESIVPQPAEERTGWLRPPDPGEWANVLLEAVGMDLKESERLAKRAKLRAKQLFAMEAMAKGIEGALNDALALGVVGSPDTWRVLGTAFIGILLAYFLFPLIYAL